MNYELIKWNRMIYGPSYYDEGEQEDPAPVILSAWKWEVRMEGRQVFWRFENKMMGTFEFSPKRWNDEGNEYPKEWPDWLLFDFIDYVWGYTDKETKVLTTSINEDSKQQKLGLV
jgi:hypothetical protein